MGEPNEEQDQPRIAWEQAEVQDGELHVAIENHPPHGWGGRFRAVLARLEQEGEDRWGEISVSRREIKVAGVHEGGESDLRHLLESVLQQVNADFTPEQDEPGEEPSPERKRDERMTEAFRGAPSAQG
jgi:hypothetical protein